MPSFKITILAALAATAAAMPSVPKFTKRQLEYSSVSKRQNKLAADMGLTDIDILQFALTLEHLEETFYRQGFAKIADKDFLDLGLNDQQLKDLKQIGQTEAEHITTLQTALTANKIAPVQSCEYDFSGALVDAKTMVATAAILENVGVSAYLGAAPLLSDPAVLGVAGSILTVEARHQSSIRVFSGQQAVPQPFDAPLGPKAVFSLAAPFFKSCPEGSNLIITPFPSLAQVNAATALVRGETIALKSEASGKATHCAFTSGGLIPGGTIFTPLNKDGTCLIPERTAGVTYVSLSSAGPIEGNLTDDITVAGPIAVVIS